MKQTIYKWSYRELLEITIAEELAFGGIPWILPAPIRLTEIISRLIWANSHLANDDMRAWFRVHKPTFFFNWWMINVLGVVYAVLWSYWFTIPIPIITHSLMNTFVFHRLHKRLKQSYLKDFFEQVDPI